MKESFWVNLESLIQSAEIVIDRPKGSHHPRYPSMIYPLDYGYIKGTTSGDGNELDVWQGIILQKRLEAVVCTVDLLKKDVEVKLLLSCTEEEKTQIYEFYKNSNCIAAIMIKREGN